MAGRAYLGGNVIDAIAAALAIKTTASGINATIYKNKVPKDTASYPFYVLRIVTWGRDVATNKTSWIDRYMVDINGWSDINADDQINAMVNDASLVITENYPLPVTSYNSIHSDVVDGFVEREEDFQTGSDAEQQLWRGMITAEIRIENNDRS